MSRKSNNKFQPAIACKYADQMGEGQYPNWFSKPNLSNFIRISF